VRLGVVRREALPHVLLREAELAQPQRCVLHDVVRDNEQRPIPSARGVGTNLLARAETIR
jgi:hypothetical protein